jgi:hypothetical protein
VIVDGRSEHLKRSMHEVARHVRAHFHFKSLCYEVLSVIHETSSGSIICNRGFSREMMPGEKKSDIYQRAPLFGS